MKKLFGIFSLSVLLFSTFAPAFTYATEAEEEAKEILINELNDLSGNLNSESDTQDVISLSNDYSLSDNDGYEVTFDLDGGYWTEETDESLKYEDRKVISNGNEIGVLEWRTPSKDGNSCNGKKCMFDGWYLGTDSNAKRWTGYVSSDMTVYAKWLEFEDLTVTIGGVSFTLMDRNLGATSSYTSNNSSRGYVFQWGNNYGFKMDTSSTMFPNAEKTLEDQMELPKDYVSNYYNGVRNTNTGSWFVYRTDHKNLWGGGSYDNPESDRQGPCPKGYHVPNYKEWDQAYRLNNFGDDLVSILKLPKTYYYDTYNNNVATNKYHYWGATDGVLVYGHDYSNFYEGRFQNYYNYGYGTTILSFSPSSELNSVRCFKDTGYKRIIMEKNGGYTTFDVNRTPKWWESRTYLPNVSQYSVNVTRENSIFGGWYTTENFQEGTLITYNDIETDQDEITIYAKRSCNDGYVMSNDGKSCIGNRAILYSNFGNNEMVIGGSDNLENPFNNDGYRFIGWNTEKDGNGDDYSQWDLILNSGLILYAQREKNPWYTFNAMDGSFGSGNIKTIKYNMYTKKYSHSPNIDLNGNINGKYENDTSINDVITITGASRLHVNLKYNIQSSYDYLYVFNKVYNGSLDSRTNGYTYRFSGPGIEEEKLLNNTGFYINGNTVTLSFYSNSDNNFYGYYATIEGDKGEYKTEEIVPIPNYPGYEFLGWYEENSETPFNFENTPVTEDKTLYAHWKSLEEKSEETTTKNVVYTNNTTVTVGDETTEETLSGSSTLKLVTEEVKEQEVTAEEDKTTVKESEIKVTSDKKVEYEGGLEVYLEKTENVGMANETTGKVEGTIKFSAPIAVKIPVSSEAEYVKVQVKHEGEEFGFKGLTLNSVNECSNGEAVNDKYNGEDVEVKENNGERYATIYTCSASTFVAYTESVKPADPKPSAGGGRVIKQESNATEQEHNSADLEKDNVSTETNKSTVTTTRSNETVEQKVKKVGGKVLTRGEVAVMTNILLEVFPQLIEGNKGLDDVTKACTSYTDEKDFTKEEKKAITRLCKLSIMGIHAEDKTALEEFMVSKESTNNEFNVVVNRAIENYNEKDFEAVKEALKKLEGDNEGVVFGTVYDVFMGIKNIFN